MAEGTGPTGRGRWFATTQWSIVLAVGSGDEEASRQALTTLCEVYWRPVYAFIRSRGHDAETARDLTQGFFTTLLERRGFEAARRERGRFRSFLLASVKNFLSHERERERALRRGGGSAPLSLDTASEEAAFTVPEPSVSETPETIFEQRWAAALLDRALADVQADLEAAGQGARFRVLRPYVAGDAAPPYARIASDLGLTETASRVALHRLRQRFATALRERVAQTVEDPGKVDEELRHLAHRLGG